MSSRSWRRRLFPDELFADLFPSGRGRPSVPADVMASVIVLQTLHGLSDSETTDAVTFDLRWKAAIGWPVTHEAFHDTTLTYWRRRLAASAEPNRIFHVVQQVIAETGALKGKTRRALDCTVLDDAVATQNTVTQLIAAIRRVRREVPGAKAGSTAADAVGLLALVAGQDVEVVDPDNPADPPQWRIARRVAPDRVISTVDPEARHAHKTVHRRQGGFKAHLAVEPETGLVTDCKLIEASGVDSHDAVVGIDLLTNEAEPVQVLGDSAYATGEALAAFDETGHEPMVKPWPTTPAVAGGFTIEDFTVDTTQRTVTCPAGNTVPLSPGGAASFGSRCASCPLTTQCTTAARVRLRPDRPGPACAPGPQAARRPSRTHSPVSCEQRQRWLSLRVRREPRRGSSTVRPPIASP